LRSLVAHRARGCSVRFRGVEVTAPHMATTWRIMRDIWGDGEYDLPGYVPRPGWRVVDVGANVGIFAMLAASRGASVVAYEPQPDVFRALERNTAKWAVGCRQAAVVGAPRGTAKLFINPTRDTRSTLSGQEVGESGGVLSESLEVTTVSMKEVLAQPVDLLKIDCEGGEFEIFANGGNALRNAARVIGEIHLSVGSLDQALHDLRVAGFETAVHRSHPNNPWVLFTAERRRDRPPDHELS
jgi:FkbM family methyltransferase